MPYQIEFVNDSVLLITFLGESDSSEHLRCRDEAARLCQEKGLSALLVDMSQQTAFMASKTLDLFKFGESFLAGDFPTQTRIAVVADSSLPVGKDVNFVVTVARNRGFRIRLFPGQEEALQWLQQ